MQSTFVFGMSLVTAVFAIIYVTVKLTLALSDLKRRLEKAEAVVDKVDAAMSPEPVTPGALLGFGMVSGVLGLMLGGLLSDFSRREEESKHTYRKQNGEEVPLEEEAFNRATEAQQEAAALRSAQENGRQASQRKDSELERRIQVLESKMNPPAPMEDNPLGTRM